MLYLLHIGMVLFVIMINIFVIKELRAKNQLLSPYMFFYIMISIELIGPLVYYYVLNGDSYRSFSENALLLYYFMAVFASFVFLFQIKFRKRVTIKGFHFYKRGREKILFRVYMVLVITIVAYYLIAYRHQLLLLNILRGNNDSLIRSDTSGLIPHWYAISSLISLVVPSFYFLYSKKIKSPIINYILFFTVAFLTIIDGNKGLFVYLILFMFMYIYNFKMNKYTVSSALAAFFLYYLLKAGSISQIGIIIESAFRRFFVTQGACFINRIQMIFDGYDFSNSERISQDVYTYMYHTSGGSAPTVFWGDIFVKYGLIVLIIIIVISNWFLYRFSEYIQRDYYDDRFMYWSFSSIAYMLCMSELSFDHILRVLLVLFNCIVFLATIGKKNKPEGALYGNK